MEKPQWKQFEDDVKNLLKLRGWNVSDEIIIDGKKVDCYAEEYTSVGDIVKYVVEIKDYDSKLSRDQLINIVADYLGIIDTDKVDKLLIVTRNGITPSAEAYVENYKKVKHIEYLALQNVILNFQRYLQGVISDYENLGIDEYYIESQCVSSTEYLMTSLLAEEALLNWTETEEYDPVVVLASYGIGKTTLAKRFAWKLAKKHKLNPRTRIPIYIPLEGIAVEQSIAGLIATHIANHGGVTNYNYSIFEALLQQGRFVVILDGFDEMQQAMSKQALQFNFNQINLLAKGKSKLVVLGRESVFLNSEERDRILYGKHPESLLYNESRQVRYKQIELCNFDSNQIDEFVRKYSAVYAKEAKAADVVEAAEKILEFMKTKDGHALSEIASRPVQLKMLIEVGPSVQDDLREVTLIDLYKYFIHAIVIREMKKSARQYYNVDERKEFATEIAWWLWKGGRHTGIRIDQIPDEIILPFVREDKTLLECKRDLVTACFLDKKEDDIIYFSHRTFLEYLVAKKLFDAVNEGSFVKQSKIAINKEIFEFIYQMIKRSSIETLIDTISQYNGSLSEWVIALITRIALDRNSIENDILDQDNPWPLVCLLYAVSNKLLELKPDEEKALYEKYLLSVPRAGKKAQKRAKLKILLVSLYYGEIAHCVGSEYCKEQIKELSRYSGTYSWMNSEESKILGKIIDRHLDDEYCYVEDWFDKLIKASDRSKVVFIVKSKKKKEREKHRVKKEGVRRATKHEDTSINIRR